MNRPKTANLHCPSVPCHVVAGPSADDSAYLVLRFPCSGRWPQHRMSTSIRARGTPSTCYLCWGSPHKLTGWSSSVPGQQKSWPQQKIRTNQGFLDQWRVEQLGWVRSQPRYNLFNIGNAGCRLDGCESLSANSLFKICWKEKHTWSNGLLKDFDILLMLPNVPQKEAQEIFQSCNRQGKAGKPRKAGKSRLRWMAFRNANFRIRRMTCLELKCSSSSACPCLQTAKQKDEKELLAWFWIFVLYQFWHVSRHERHENKTLRLRVLLPFPGISSFLSDSWNRQSLRSKLAWKLDIFDRAITGWRLSVLHHLHTFFQLILFAFFVLHFEPRQLLLSVRNLRPRTHLNLKHQILYSLFQTSKWHVFYVFGLLHV